MAFDSLTLHSVTAQLSGTIVPGKVLNVIQSSPFEFTLRIAAHGKRHNLLFSIHPVHARMHLAKTFPKRAKRWHFADFLHNHIGDGEITDIEQVDLDRIVRIRVLPPGEIIDPVPKILIGEFMGKHSNIILIEEGTNRILESIKHIDETMSRHREVLPGLSYVAPPAGQALDLLSTDEETFLSVLASDKGPLWRRLLRNFQGVSPLLAKEAVARAPDDSPEAVRDILIGIMTDARAGKSYPTVITRDNDGQDVLGVSAVELKQFHHSHTMEFPTISDALEYYYQRLTEKESLQAEKAAILQAVKKKYEAVQQKHESLSQQLEIAESADDLKLSGELLIANLYRLKRGQKEASLQNFHDPNNAEVTIQLDEKLSPADNAQRYFDRYKKAKRSKDVLVRLTKKSNATLKFMQTVMEETEQAESLGDLAAIRSNLEQKGIIKERRVGKRKARQETTLFRRFKSSDGFQMLMGRNEKENELLLKRESSKNDMWLHAKQIQGSYVIVRNPERRPDIPKRTLLQAAIIAANFSKAKHSSLVPVDYTWVKYVNKPRGAKPGFVIYTHEKTLFVSPADFDKLSLQPDSDTAPDSSELA